MIKVVFLRFGAVKSGKRCLLHTFFSPFDERENLALPLFFKTTNSNPLAFV